MNKKRINAMLQIFLCLIIALGIISTVVVSAYTVNQSDDYSHAVKVGQFHSSWIEYFFMSLGFMGRMYRTWAGNYYSMFLQSFLSPLNMGGNSQLRIVMVVNALLFFTTLIVLLYRFIGKMINTSSILKLFIIALVLYPLMNYKVYYEIFYWFSGATSYSLPLSCLFVSLILLLNHNRKIDGSYIVALVLGFLGVGGSLTISGTVCFVLLLSIIYLYLENGLANLKYMLFVFAIYVLGTFVNFIAPGNYVRAGRSAGGLGIVRAIKNTLVALYTEYYWLFRNTNFLLVMLILLIVGISLETVIRFNLRNYLIVSILGLLTPAVSVFPVVLGYNSSYLANRTLFVIEQSLVLSFVNVALVVGILIARYVGDVSKRVAGVCIGIVAVCFMALNGYGIKDHEVLKTTMNVLNGVYSNYYKECGELESYFKQCKGEDVVMHPEDIPVPLENFSNLYLENSWVNEGIADYYGMNTLILEIDERGK